MPVSKQVTFNILFAQSFPATIAVIRGCYNPISSRNCIQLSPGLPYLATFISTCTVSGVCCCNTIVLPAVSRSSAAES